VAALSFFERNVKNTLHRNYLLGRCPYRIPVLSSIENSEFKIIINFNYL
jgi:hypothetical protein